MSRAQWGHGYYSGMTMAAEQEDRGKHPLVGRWFHTFKDGRLDRQGQILASIPEQGILLVQLYDWLMGHPSKQVLVRQEEVEEWTFYASAADMRAAVL